MTGLQVAPEVSVEIDGSRLELPRTTTFTSVHVRAGLSFPTQFELGFEDQALALASRFAPGTPLTVRVARHDEPLVVGEVTACEYGYSAEGRHTLRVRGYDPLHRLRKRHRTAGHSEISALSLARELGAELGLTVECASTLPVWPFLIQSRQSDLDLLTELCARCGLYPTVHGRKLLLVDLQGVGVAKTLNLGQELLEGRVEVNGELACREVQVSGWSPLSVQEFVARASAAHIGRAVEVRSHATRFGGDGVCQLVDEALLGPDHAQALAQAELDSRSLSEVVFHGVAIGDPSLRPGGVVAIAGVHPHVAGRYVLTHVRHVIDVQRGFVTELGTAPPARRARPTGSTVALGVVTSVDDPDGLGRVRVRLPGFGDVETSWMSVLALGAGPGKGLCMLPDQKDNVLVLLSREDPARGVVLGGLWGAAGAPDAGIEDGAVKRFSLVTAGGHRIQVDDKARSIRVQHRSGSFLDFSEDEVTLHAKRRLVLEAPGQAIKIRGTTVDFERK